LKRKALISALMMTCVLLAGCGGGSQQEHFEEIRSAVADAESVAFTATVTASFSDRTEEFTLDCARQGGDWTMTVTAPERIAGVTAQLSGTDSAVVYGNVMLSTGDLTSCGILPITAAPAALETLTDGYLSSSWTENGGLVVKLIRDDTVTVTVWFDENDCPAAMELAENGAVKATCAIENFTIEGKANGNTEETDLGGDSSGEPGT